MRAACRRRPGPAGGASPWAMGSAKRGKEGQGGRQAGTVSALQWLTSLGAALGDKRHIAHVLAFKNLGSTRALTACMKRQSAAGGWRS